MKISKLEIERYVEAYRMYKEDNEEKEFWLNNRDYLLANGFDYDEMIELLFNYGKEDKIVQVLEILGVEVV